MRPIQVTAGPYSAAAVANVVASNTPVSGTALTLVTTTPDTTPRRLLITFGNEASNRTLLITGTNWSGNTVSETITIPSGAGSTAISVLDYKTVVSILPGGGGWSAAMSVGTSAATTSGSSAWIRFDDYGFAQAQLQITVAGTINFTVEGSNDDPNLNTVTGIYAYNASIAPSAMTWITPDSTNLSAKTANLVYELGVASTTGPRPLWLRLTANSYTGTGNATMTVAQAGGKFG